MRKIYNDWYVWPKQKPWWFINHYLLLLFIHIMIPWYWIFINEHKYCLIVSLFFFIPKFRFIFSWWILVMTILSIFLDYQNPGALDRHSPDKFVLYYFLNLEFFLWLMWWIWPLIWIFRHLLALWQIKMKLYMFAQFKDIISFVDAMNQVIVNYSFYCLECFCDFCVIVFLHNIYFKDY